MKNQFQTPNSVAEYMVSMIPENSIKVLEPTPGLGNIVGALEAGGYQVTAPEDYFDLNSSWWFDSIVMNPPFSSKYAYLDNAPLEFIENAKGMKCGYRFLFECMEKSNSIIALMPWYTISDSDDRMRKIYEFGLKSITVLPRKTFQYARIQTCILELKRYFEGPTEFKIYEQIENSKTFNKVA